MKKYASLIAFLIVILTILWSFYDLKPITPPQAKNDTDFSIEKALTHLKNISSEVHHVGTPAHKNVQNYIVDELTKLGLTPEIQTQTIVNQKWFAGTTAENIVARIKGSGTGKALLLLSHYDSSPHSSLGASDAGSRVVTILEGVRAYLAQSKTPKNDIIILISDAEELGLLGAKAFAEYHPWAKEVGLVINFEARGSGGPSFMLMETNGKNSKMLSEFVKANPNYPVSNSLLYSIYKKLPNDTDLTVFRELNNTNGFNFAFIDDHFDYHTVQDSYERLDRTTLAHQADYLMSTLSYFSESDITDLNSDVDYVYVNFPFIKLLTYPFSWVFPMQLIAIGILLVLLFFGIALNKLQVKQLLLGFIPAILSLVICAGVSFYLWKGFKLVFPSYQDMLHKFTYNGYWYIIAFVCLNLWLLYTIYKPFSKKENTTSLLIAPIIIWLIINFFIPEDFKGAGFFIIPVFVAELILIISIFWKENSKNYPILFAILSIPTIYIFAPLIKLFPVGLGLGLLFVSALFTALVFSLMLPVLNASKSRKAFQRLMFLLTIGFFTTAILKGGFDEDKRKPNSLVYVQNNIDSVAYWGTYNQVLDSYISQKLGENPTKGEISNAETKSKYKTRFSYHTKAEFLNIPTSEIKVVSDTIIDTFRTIDFTIYPKRDINKFELSVSDSITFQKLMVNQIPVNNGNPILSKSGSFLIFHRANVDDSLHLSMQLKNNQKAEIFLNEISYDLLKNPLLKVEPKQRI